MTGREYKRFCEMCQRPYISGSAHTRWCPECRGMQYRQKARERYATGKKYTPVAFCTFTCVVCGQRYRVFERTRRRICSACLSNMGAYGRQLIRQRKDAEEVVWDDSGGKKEIKGGGPAI